MPPVWLIIGIVVVSSIWWLVDRLILRPRSRLVVVGGQDVIVRRKADVQLLNVAMFALYVVVFGIGATIEGDGWLFVVGSLTFVVLAAVSVQATARRSDATPPEADLLAARPMNRRSLQMGVVAVLTIVLTIMGQAVTGPFSWLLFAVWLVCVIAFGWVFWGWFSEYQRLRKAGHLR